MPRAKINLTEGKLWAPGKDGVACSSMIRSQASPGSRRQGGRLVGVVIREFSNLPVVIRAFGRRPAGSITRASRSASPICSQPVSSSRMLVWVVGHVLEVAGWFDNSEEQNFPGKGRIQRPYAGRSAQKLPRRCPVLGPCRDGKSRVERGWHTLSRRHNRHLVRPLR